MMEKIVQNFHHRPITIMGTFIKYAKCVNPESLPIKSVELFIISMTFLRVVLETKFMTP